MRQNEDHPLLYDVPDAGRVLTYTVGQLAAVQGQRTAAETGARSTTQHERWWMLVEEYTSRHLSYGQQAARHPRPGRPSPVGAPRVQDLVATRTEAVRYIAGLWSGDAFVMGLLWYVRDGSTTRPASRAPSWTWAAVDGVIGHNSLHGDARLDACGVPVLKLPDPHDPRLVLRARLKPATWHRAPDGRKMCYVGHRRHSTVRYQHDLARYEPLAVDPTQGPDAKLLRDLAGRDIGYLVLDSDSELPTENAEVYCLAIVVKPTTRKEERDFNVPWAARGLALVKDVQQSGTYRRIGYVELQRTPGGLSYPSSLNPGRQRAERNPPPRIDVAGFWDGSQLSTVALV